MESSLDLSTYYSNRKISQICGREFLARSMVPTVWWWSGRSLAQVSASFAVFFDGRRTPRLRVLSLLRLSSDMLEGARGSERRSVVIFRCVECRERERCSVSARNMLARAKGSERRGVVICKVLGVQRERERGAL